MSDDCRPLILHVVYRFDTGGLENGVVNLINEMDPQAYRHAVLALTEVTEFRQRVRRSDVKFIALHKPPGHGFWLYPKLYRLLRELRPAVVHTRNLAALEVVVPAWAAGVPVRVHGEHGRDVGDLDGTHRGYQRLRRLYGLFVHRFVALSRDLAGYLHGKVGLPQAAIRQIYNGVDIRRFQPAAKREALAGCDFGAPEHFIIGTVGRMQTVKDQTNLARAFVLALQQRPDLRPRLRLVMAGAGPLREQAQQLLAEAGVAELAWLPGERADVAGWMRGLDCFVLPSLAEGVSNTILEAMACGLPVIATAVGGNVELVEEGRSGLLVPAADPQALAASLVKLADDGALARRLGATGRRSVEQRFAMPVMVAGYQGLYDELLAARAPERIQMIKS
ncbi:TIGR03088 family PEP-CTERM/XrtA system glycosyltransferase [Paucibacter sp. PLA-PC-4]|uniref:TIGR03088 family PEP-CTERM/XrtA system glycosyltransferase n=1 Tax=Paucibacter sp. PLA-PC-4 TaxID=2993655 RepID=UPI00224A7427|nr:TIGR03088 family PEP-CTERM/XrtA system glycosyltransferase [Paucibacter sp. PLA-PC-4]MCX2865031.1 TIGR03088 family PEP-CTERM/XrtA system glycosyltransferase [Paucibacter sp. PLA-PC-4]